MNRIVAIDLGSSYTRIAAPCVTEAERAAGSTLCPGSMMLERLATPGPMNPVNDIGSVVAHLKHVKEVAERKLQQTVDRAVITISAAATQRFRDGLRKAGNQAGFQQVTLLPEPLAIASAFGARDDRSRIRVVTCNMGGGKLEVACVELENGAWSVLHFDGNSVGGRVFDEALVSWVLRRERSKGRDLVDEVMGPWSKRWLLQLRKTAEVVKVSLSNQEEATFTAVLSLNRNEPPITLDQRITRSEFELLIRPLVGEALRVAGDQLSAVLSSGGTIDEVLLTGGSAPIPSWARGVQEIFAREPHILEPECAALGAARWEQQQTAQADQAQVLIKPVLDRPVRLGLADGGYRTVIASGTPLPTQARLSLVVGEDATTTDLHMYLGEERLTFELPRFTSGTRVEVTFNVDHECRVSARVHADTLGQTMDLTASTGGTGLDTEQSSHASEPEIPFVGYLIETYHWALDPRSIEELSESAKALQEAQQAEPTVEAMDGHSGGSESSIEVRWAHNRLRRALDRVPRFVQGLMRVRGLEANLRRTGLTELAGSLREHLERVESRLRGGHASNAELTRLGEFAKRASLELDLLKSKDESSLGLQAESASRSAEMPGGRVDLVHFSVTAPASVLVGGAFTIDIWAHLDAQRDVVVARAREASPRGPILVQSKGPTRLARGTVLTARLTLEDLVVEPDADTVLWEGEAGNAGFHVRVPREATAGPRHGTALIYADWLKIARIDFVIEVAASLSEVTALSARETRTRTAFASYASSDQEEVVARIQGILKGAPGIDIFWDRHSLRSGERWADVIQREIPKRDVFYLFWSLAASQSRWVKEEWLLALESRGIDYIDPVPLVSPDEVPPPAELGGTLHFNDWTLAYRRSAQRHGRG